MLLQSLLYTLIGVIIGAALGWYFTIKTIKKQLKENPPINRKMIRDLYLQIGRKPSETEINRITKKFNTQYQKNITKEVEKWKR